MENHRDLYKSQIKDYVCSLDIDSTKKKQIYVALNGGIYASLKEKKGKGTKTMYFQDGSKQRVDTYEGRFKAVSKILGDDLENSQALYKLVLGGDYRTKARNSYFKETAEKKYLEIQELKEIRERDLDGKVLAISATKTNNLGGVGEEKKDKSEENHYVSENNSSSTNQVQQEKSVVVGSASQIQNIEKIGKFQDGITERRSLESRVKTNSEDPKEIVREIKETIAARDRKNDAPSEKISSSTETNYSTAFDYSPSQAQQEAIVVGESVNRTINPESVREDLNSPENPSKENSQVQSEIYLPKKNSLLNKISLTSDSFLKRMALISACGLGLGYFICSEINCGNSKNGQYDSVHSNQEIVQVLEKPNVSKKDKAETQLFVEVPTLEKPQGKNNYYEKLAQSEIEFSERLAEFYDNKNENIDTNEGKFSNLERLLRDETQQTLQEISPEDSNPLENCSLNEETTLTPQENKKEFSQRYYVIKDLKKYVDHTNQRNAQIVEGDISINPSHLIKQTGNNFVPLKDELTDFSSVGYSKEDFSNRTKGIKSGLKKLGNGLQKLVSLGFWDSRKEEEKTNEGNQVLRVLKSPYDIVLGTVQSAVNSVDYVAAGILGKTLNTTIDATRGVVGTVISTTNYVGALPFYPLDKAEELLQKNTCSQKVYETVFSLARFGGNVLSHEVPERGKTIEIISNDGKKVVLEKGELGATLELITGLGLDSFAISKLLDGSGSSHSNGNNGETPSNGGVVIIPGNGGSVGGGM